jgi:hypothetical protein
MRLPLGGGAKQGGIRDCRNRNCRCFNWIGLGEQAGSGISKDCIIGCIKLAITLQDFKEVWAVSHILLFLRMVGLFVERRRCERWSGQI